jgi:hypothetical protein
VAELTLPIEALPAGQDRHGGRRFGEERWAVDGDKHGFVAIATSEDTSSIGF